MNGIEIETDLFEHRGIKPDAINQCSFGQDFAAWLQERLRSLIGRCLCFLESDPGRLWLGGGLGIAIRGSVLDRYLLRRRWPSRWPSTVDHICRTDGRGELISTYASQI